MAKPQGPAKRSTLQVSTEQRPDFKHPLAAFVFDSRGQLLEYAGVRDGKVELSLPSPGAARVRVFIAPVDPHTDHKALTPSQLERLGAYEPLSTRALTWRIDIPGSLIDIWPFCFCWVRGKAVRASDNRAVCNARVHICEVDRLRQWIFKLSDADIFRLRDDLLEVIDRPPIPRPGPGPDPGPLRGVKRAALRFSDDVLSRVSLNPQPLPPLETFALPAQIHARLSSTSSLVVRKAFVEQWKSLLPWFCFWPRWLWIFQCDELAVVETDATGRFEATLLYPCGGDRPDLYFWVEYDFGGGFETVYHPNIACHTHWDYLCGSEVTIRITDPRVPGCEGEPDLPDCQVVVLSIGQTVAVRQVQTSGAEGLTTAGEPFGATLEPRVDFSRTELIDVKKIPYYRWSYRRLSGPDGSATTVDPSSVPINAWSVMTRDVYRHYKVGTSYPSDFMGPLPTSGPGAAPTPNMFRIRPAVPPAGNEWVVLNEDIDLATAYFESSSLAGAPPVTAPPPVPDDLAAGRYELKLELFDSTGALVDWTAKDIDLRITVQDAPFGAGTVTTVPAPAYNRVLSTVAPLGNTVGFRMVVRVDNNRCTADVLPVGGTVSPDPVCGFHNYGSPSDTAGLSFVARHPNGFGTYGFATRRGAGPGDIAAASTFGTAGAAGTNGFLNIGSFTYGKDVVISSLLGSCTNAAFSERLTVNAMATNGYGRLSGYDADDDAAFALAMPCPDCSGEDA